MTTTGGPPVDRSLARQVIENDFKVKEVHARLRAESEEPSRG